MKDDKVFLKHILDEVDFKKRHSEIEWRELAGLRDKLIHHYFGINWDRVWDVVENFVPKLKEQLQELTNI